MLTIVYKFITGYVGIRTSVHSHVRSLIAATMPQGMQ